MNLRTQQVKINNNAQLMLLYKKWNSKWVFNKMVEETSNTSNKTKVKSSQHSIRKYM